MKRRKGRVVYDRLNPKIEYEVLRVKGVPPLGNDPAILVFGKLGEAFRIRKTDVMADRSQLAPLPRLYDRGPGHSPRFEPGDDPSLYTVEGNARRLHENDERIAAIASRDRVYRGYFVIWDSLGKKYEIYREEDGKPGRFEQYATSKDHARRIIDAIHGD